MNDDVVMEILLALPAKTLTTFKTISKDWLSLISSDHFRRLHTLRHPKPPPSLLIRQRQTSQSYFYFNPLLKTHNLTPYTFSIPNPKILSSCNGLMLLRSGEDYYVYNPTTKQSRKFIPPNCNDEYTQTVGLNLAFDPSKSTHYKIVCVKKATSSSGQFLIEVYSSENLASPEIISEPFAIPPVVDFNNGVFCKNAIHWAVFHLDGGLYYDIYRNAVERLPDISVIFNGQQKSYAPGCFEEANGRLHQCMTVAEVGGEFIESWIAVYELHEDYSRWLLKHRCEYRREFYNSGMMSLTAGEGGEESILVDHAPGKITAYRFGEGRCVEVVDCSNQAFYRPDDCGQFDNRDVYQFRESLAPV